MRMLNPRVAVATVAVVAAVLPMALQSVAGADTGARTGDVVGVGSDTIQNAADFLFDGAPGLVNGYNSQGNVNRVWNFFATGDANGRAIFDGTCGAKSATTGLGTDCGVAGGTTAAPQTANALTSSVILRAGTKPVVRPNGSGAGVAALIADGTTGYEGLPTGSIQYARMSRLPNTTEEGECTATTAGCDGLHVYQAATDQLVIAHDSASYNGPSGLSADELYNIFVTCSITKWNQLPGNTAGNSDTIHPLIPQSGSGTRNFFLADLAAAEGLTTTLTPGSCTRTVEEHDPTGIYGDPDPADAIEPFSLGKLSLINSGYFANGAGYTGSSFANGAYTPNFLTYLKGAPGDTKPVYDSTRGLYFVIRQSDLADTTPFQPGGTENWAQTLFAGPDSWIARSANAGLVSAAGFTQAYKDCGVNPTTC